MVALCLDLLATLPTLPFLGLPLCPFPGPVTSFNDAASEFFNCSILRCCTHIPDEEGGLGKVSCNSSVIAT